MGNQTSQTSPSKLLPGPVFTAGKEKGKKGKGKDGKDFVPPLVDGKGKGGYQDQPEQLPPP